MSHMCISNYQRLIIPIIGAVCVIIGTMKKERKITSARAINKMRYIVGLIICLIVIVLTVVSFILNVTNFYNESTPESGLGTLRTYTTLSNLIAALAASICVPFQIDGLRKDRYKLPKWVVEVMYAGSVGVFLTFVMAISVISVSSGFIYAMFTNSNFFMHTLNPIFITILFTVAISDARIKFSRSFWSIVPTIAYGLLYFVFALATGIWRDNYRMQDYLPWPVTFLLILIAVFGLSQVLRLLHNSTNKYVSKHIEKYYKESPDYEFEKITFAIEKLAQEQAKYYSDGEDIYIPVDIIKMLSERYSNTTLPLDIQYDIYLENYLKSIKPE